MRDFVELCRANDRRRRMPDGTTLSMLVVGIIVGMAVGVVLAHWDYLQTHPEVWGVWP